MKYEFHEFNNYDDNFNYSYKKCYVIFCNEKASDEYSILSFKKCYTPHCPKAKAKGMNTLEQCDWEHDDFQESVEIFVGDATSPYEDTFVFVTDSTEFIGAKVKYYYKLYHSGVRLFKDTLFSAPEPSTVDLLNAI